MEAPPMAEDWLGDVLRQADASAPPAQVRPDLAGRVQMRIVRRQRFRVRTRAVAAAIVLAAALTVPWRADGIADGPRLGHGARPPVQQQGYGSTSPTGLDALLNEVGQLERVIAVHADTAELLRERAAQRAAEAARKERLREIAEKLQMPSPDDQLREQVERAVVTLVRHGYRLQHDLDDTAAAETVYRQAAALAPESPWGQVARQQLEQMHHRQGDRS